MRASGENMNKSGLDPLRDSRGLGGKTFFEVNAFSFRKSHADAALLELLSVQR